MKVIIVTGTPGTGKTTLSVKLAKKLDFHYIDVNEIVKGYGLSEGYDRKRKTQVIDVKKLNMALIKEISTIKKNSIKKYNSIINSNKKIKSHLNKKFDKNNSNINKKNNKKIKKGIIIDSHLAHYLPKRYVDLCIVAKCGLKTLKERLRRKKYSKEKVRENLDAEIFDICLNEAKETMHNIIVIDTTKGLNMRIISRKIR